MFFSDSRWFALALFLASFTDVSVGISGLCAVVMALLSGRLAGFRPDLLANGTYTYNVLLVGLTMGAYFRPDAVFFVVLFLASLMTLLMSIWLHASLSRRQLPMLSLPFVLSIWIMLLTARHFHALGLNERGIYHYNELWSAGGMHFLNFYLDLDGTGLPGLFVAYLKSMGAIFFQSHALSGLLIALGLLLYSRIAFSLSLIGFFSGYWFCSALQGNLSDIAYSYIGFNYILTAMALGGFFLVPSVGSYILAALSAPLVSLFSGALGSVTSGYLLSFYSLPFTLVVLLILCALYHRSDLRYLYPVRYQLFSPEKNLYLYRHYSTRFREETLVPVQLPFYGEWTVSQGYEGSPTHQGDWCYALDFVVTDDQGKTYRLPGEQLSDYYCYQLPVLAPADGLVEAIHDGVEANLIGRSNLERNWGNTIILRHGEQLYTKLSHLRADSFKVKVGDTVKRGELLALCGSSGRSPEPHLHFQVQRLPLLGAATIPYPLSSYLARSAGAWELHTFSVPEEGQQVKRPLPATLFTEAFCLAPGSMLRYRITKGQAITEECWEVFDGSEGLRYLYCASSASFAWFRTDGLVFWFTSFSGDRNSLLYYFYLGAQKLLLNYTEGLVIREELPTGTAYRGALRWLQDAIAPFHVFLTSRSETHYVSADHEQSPSRAILRTHAKAFAGRRTAGAISVELTLEKNVVRQITVNDQGICFSACAIA